MRGTTTNSNAYSRLFKSKIIAFNTALLSPVLKKTSYFRSVERLYEIYHLFRKKSRVLQTLLVVLGIFYFFAGTLPKECDYWVITNVSTAFAVDPLHFMVGVKGIAFPPTFYALQGGVAVAWLKSFSLQPDHQLQPDSCHVQSLRVIFIFRTDKARYLPSLGNDTNISGAVRLYMDSIQGATE